jgi:succinoglycan biosynthesis transport protein ExoP
LICPRQTDYFTQERKRVNVEEKEPGLRDLLTIFDRRRNVFLGSVLCLFLISALLCIFMTRRYRATGVFEMQASETDSLDLSDLTSTNGSSSSLSSATTVELDLQTEADILKSDTLALQVIKELDLEHNPDFKPHFNPISWAVTLISPAGPADPKGTSLDDMPHLRTQLLKTFSRHLDVKVVEGTREIEVQFSNCDRKVAAQIVNHLIQALIEFNFQTKYKATTEVSTWLDAQLGDLRKQNENLQDKVVEIQKGSGIFGTGATDIQGKPVVYAPVLDRLQQSSAILSQSKVNAIIKGAIYQVAKTGNAELISQLAGTTLMQQTSSGVTDSLSLINNLRTQEAALKSQYERDATQYGPASPKLMEEVASIKTNEQLLHQEIERIKARAENDYNIALETQKGAQATYASDEGEADKLNDKAIQFSIVSKESQEADDLYQDLLKRLKEAGILEGLKSTNLNMVDVARVPDKPHSPNVPLYLALGVAAGLFLGGCGALLAEAVDNKVQGLQEVEAMKLPVLGILPRFELTELENGPNSPEFAHSFFGEAIRSLRSTLLISRSSTPPKVILISSGGPREGKSTVSLNFARSLAQFNKKVLIVEADMRRPTLARTLNLNAGSGVSALLADESAQFEPEALPGHPNLDIIASGPIPPYPAELLGSPRMRSLMEEWRKSYDFVVIDSPPVLPVTDAQLLEELADTTILVARSGKTARLTLQRAYNLLASHAKDPDNPNVGIVLNCVPLRSAAYYGYHGYYGGSRYEYREGGRAE